MANSLDDCLIYASFCRREPSASNDASNWLDCYDPSINAWQRVTRIPELSDNLVLKGFSMVSMDDWVYIIGGRLCRKVMGQGAENDLEVRSLVLRYNVRTDTWIRCAPLLTPRFEFACAVTDKKIYVAGGKCELRCGAGISSAEVYDPSLDEWISLPHMSTMRYNCVGVNWQGKFHVVGGFAGKVGSWCTVERSSAEAYDSETAEWKIIAGMWQLDVPPNQIIPVEEKLFSSGDCLKVWKGHLDAYDGRHWNEVEGSCFMTISRPFTSTGSVETQTFSSFERLYLTVAAIGTRLYFLVGYRTPGESSRMTSVVHVFDTATNTWRSFEPNEEEGEKEGCGHSCVVRLSNPIELTKS